MKIKEYIESGVLEEFSLGLLSHEKAWQVYKLSLKYPEIQSELVKIQETLFRLDLDAAINPPTQIKNKLMGIVGPSESGETTYTYPLRKFLIAASISIVITFIGSIIYFNKTLNEFSDQNYLSQNNNQKELILKSFSGEDNFFAIAVIRNEKVFLNISELPIPPEGMQYQLWEILGEHPVSVGLIPRNHDLNELIEFEMQIGTKAIAISLEPSGGKVQPTQEMIKVIGSI